MIYQVIYTKPALGDLKRFPRTVAQRIAKKIHWFSLQDNPLQFAAKLRDARFGEYRFRVGDYRAIFDLDPRGIITILVILRVKHRREVYRDL